MSEKLFCHQCDQLTDFEIRDNVLIQYPVRDVVIPILGKLAICSKCGKEVNHLEVDEENQRIAFNQYRIEKGVLTPEQIKEIRNKYNLNQRDFSRLLGFGEITISRYERGSLPTAAHNQIIRESANPEKMLEMLDRNGDKIDKAECEQLKRQLLKQLEESEEQQIVNKIKDVFNNTSSIFSGNKQFNLKKFKQMVAFFAVREKPYKTKLNKLLFYADFYFFKKYGGSISGSKYICHNYGPVPDQYESLYANLNNVEIKEDLYGEYIAPLAEFDDSVFSKEELDMLEFVYQKFKHKYAKTISDFSHDEEGWIKTPFKEYISYEFAHNLDPMRPVK